MCLLPHLLFSAMDRPPITDKKQITPQLADTLIPRDDDKNKYGNIYLRLVSNYGIASSCIWQKYVFQVQVIKRLDAFVWHLDLLKVINNLVTLKDSLLQSALLLRSQAAPTYLIFYMCRDTRSLYRPFSNECLFTSGQRVFINPKAPL